MPTGKIDKVIITNISALIEKYGNDGVQKIKDAIADLIAADNNRGLVTALYALDDATVMQQFGVAPVTTPTDPKQNKDGIDAIYKALAPDYLLLLGAIDIIPHQDLTNPAYDKTGEGDDDKVAFGDLPYACESGYSQNAQDFYGPTRVVGRLPDITGAKDPQYLLNLLKIATSYKDTDAASYQPYFGISAEIWEDSTKLSLSAIFGNSVDLKTIPPNGPKWPSPMLQRLSHFINCHGALNSSQFYGQPASGASRYPVALDASNLNQAISEGTMIAAECCYGAQLFDPALNAVTKGQMGIANTYLANKAYGFFGSTTIAFGSADSNDEADLICQYFLESILTGASLGRAALEARQKFIHTMSMSDPTDVKTISQYNLYGDPSITPIKPPQALEKGLVSIPSLAQRLERTERRRNLFSRGLALAKSQPTISEDLIQKEDAILAALNKAAADHRLSPRKILTFKVKAPSISDSMPARLFSKEVFPSRVHLIYGKPIDMEDAEMEKEGVPPVVKIVALIAREFDGTIQSVKKIVSR